MKDIKFELQKKDVKTWSLQLSTQLKQLLKLCT